MKKILFLDFDGVLNNTNFLREESKTNPDAFRCLDPENCKNLKWILFKIPDLQIVISSTWRILYTMFELKKKLSEHGIQPCRIVDRTPRLTLSGTIRGLEIQRWLDDNIKDECQFIILDDDSDMGDLFKYLLNIDRYVGLNNGYAQRVVEWFEGCRGHWRKPLICQ